MKVTPIHLPTRECPISPWLMEINAPVGSQEVVGLNLDSQLLIHIICLVPLF